jgi:hypothetical protein
MKMKIGDEVYHYKKLWKIVQIGYENGNLKLVRFVNDWMEYTFCSQDMVVPKDIYESELYQVMQE